LFLIIVAKFESDKVAKLKTKFIVFVNHKINKCVRDCSGNPFFETSRLYEPA